METLTMHIKGLPMPKGSVTRMRNGAYVPAGTPATRMQYGLWENNVSAVSRSIMGDTPPWDKGVAVRGEFQLPPPKTGIKATQRGWWPHIKRPDLDKLIRGLLDPMTGLVWLDDSQVMHIAMTKTYCWEGQPGAFVAIDFLNDDYHYQFRYSRQVVNVTESL